MKEYIKGLHHVGLPTTKMDDTLRFYMDFGAYILQEKMDEDEGKPIRVVLLQFCGLIIECYERREMAGIPGAFDHLAFQVEDIEKMYELAKEKGYRFMDDCKDSIQPTSYWPGDTRWFIVYGANGEKIEFCQDLKA